MCSDPRLRKICSPCWDSTSALAAGFWPSEFDAAGPPVVVLTDRLWKRRFGRNPAVIGSELMLNGVAHRVVGVLPQDFFYSQWYEFYVPWHQTGEELGRRQERWSCLVRLKDGVTAEQAKVGLESVFHNAAKEDAAKGWHMRVTPLQEEVTGRSRPALSIVLGAVAFVLLIACLNIANLLLARGADRSREIAIRAAMGAGRLRVVRQLLTESLILAITGGVVGCALGAIAANALVVSIPERIPLPRLDQTRLDTAVLLFSAGITVLTGIVFGLIPAWHATREDVNEELKQGARGAGRGRSNLLRNGMVVMETALSLVLLIGAGLMLRSLVRLLSVDPGFQTGGVLTLRVPLPSSITEQPRKVAHYTRLLEEVAKVPGLNSVGLIAPLPLASVEANATFAVEGRPVPPGESQFIKLRVASPGYFRAMSLTLLRGRVFGEQDGESTEGVAVVSDALVRRYFPDQDPIGKRVTFSSELKGPWMTVIGVVKDIKGRNLAEKAEPELYRDYRQYSFAPFAYSMVVRTQSADPASVAGAVQRQIRTADPEQPIGDVLPMKQLVSNSVSQPRFYTILLSAFAAIALLLAASGLYGVVSYSVSRRVPEIGIRVALGASRGSILRDVTGRAMILVGVGVAVGLAGAFALTRLLESQLFEVETADPATYAAVSLLLLGVGALAAYLPARRAARVDPNVALRCE